MERQKTNKQMCNTIIVSGTTLKTKDGEQRRVLSKEKLLES